MAIIQKKDKQISELKKQTNALVVELNETNQKSQNFVLQYNTQNMIITGMEHKDIQIMSNIHHINMEITNINSKIENQKRRNRPNTEIPIPKFITDLEEELRKCHEKKEKLNELISEMHKECIYQLSSCEEEFRKEELNANQKIDELNEQNSKIVEIINNVEFEYKNLKEKIDFQLQEYNAQPVDPQKLKIMEMQNEIDMMDQQIVSLETENTEIRNKLDEMNTVKSKLNNIYESKASSIDKIKLSFSDYQEKYTKKINALNNFIERQGPINETLNVEYEKWKKEFDLKNNDYVSLFKSKKLGIDGKIQKITKDEEDKQRKIGLLWQETNEKIKFYEPLCKNLENAIQKIDNQNNICKETYTKLINKSDKLDHLITKANCELKNLEILNSNENNENEKVKEIHVETFVNLPQSALSIEQDLREKNREFKSKIVSMNQEYKDLTEKEARIKHISTKLKLENDELKKFLVHLPKLKKFLKKYRKSNPSSKPKMIMVNQATISGSKLVIECH